MLKMLIFLNLLIIFITPIQAEQLKVVVTIKPIHALVKNIMGDIASPYLLLQGNESPHNYSLRPSQVRELHSANLVIWVSPNIETFLEKTINTLRHKTQILRLIDTPNLRLLKQKSSSVEHHHHEKHHVNIDPHIWLSPYNAKIIVQAITDVLIKIDNKNAKNYQHNANQLIKQLEQLDKEIQQQLFPVKKYPFLVFHNAYQYFQDYYELNLVDAITLSPETIPSIKHLYQLRNNLKQQQIQCVFTEPQFNSELINIVIENTSIKRGILDPLGANLKADKDSYFILLRNLADSLISCLNENSYNSD
ncbi:MAG: zinc ABC transporter substrate-binding protein [Thiomargarita sp.]|nr:zinc ABC transporter substrate-binding protein [Thiomargarita sp.]